MTKRYRRLLVFLLAGFAAAFEGRTVDAATNFNVGAQGMSAYVIDGANNPTLTLTRGQTYTFNLTVAGHPFWITKARGAGDVDVNAYTTGVSGNGASPGTVTFAVPASAPSTLFYQCSFHDPMAGMLSIVGAPAAVPATGLLATLALAGILLLVAVCALRPRPRSRARSAERLVFWAVYLLTSTGSLPTHLPPERKDQSAMRGGDGEG